MNYYGFDSADNKRIFEFLKKCLRSVAGVKPFRGLNVMKKDDIEYRNKVKVSVEKFSDREIIFMNNKEVYSLNYHDSTISIVKGIIL